MQRKTCVTPKEQSTYWILGKISIFMWLNRIVQLSTAPKGWRSSTDVQTKSNDASKYICERSLYGSVMPDPPQNCYMFWCKLQVDIFWTPVPSITCGILPCSPLDQVSPNPNRQHIHHSQQRGNVTHQQARRLSALTATETFAENKPQLPARAVKGPELLTGSGREASSLGKCHLKF